MSFNTIYSQQQKENAAKILKDLGHEDMSLDARDHYFEQIDIKLIHDNQAKHAVVSIGECKDNCLMIVGDKQKLGIFVGDVVEFSYKNKDMRCVVTREKPAERSHDAAGSSVYFLRFMLKEI